MLNEFKHTETDYECENCCDIFHEITPNSVKIMFHGDYGIVCKDCETMFDTCDICKTSVWCNGGHILSNRKRVCDSCFVLMEMRGNRNVINSN